MVKRNPRYIEISRRNPISKIRVASGSYCSPSVSCGDVCIEIRRAGHAMCAPKVEYDSCCQPIVKLPCETLVARVCAIDVDDNGFAVFEWPSALFGYPEGWYEGHVMTGCNSCGVLPLRIGPRCNVVEVEFVTVGPDCADWVGCDDGKCVDDICPSTGKSLSKTVYVPDYEVF